MDYFRTVRAIKDEINRVFVGKEDIVEQVMTALLAGGHILLEDVPGVGKTTLGASLAKVMECSFGRIQFTPDTLPGDIIGISVYNMKSGEFEFREGVVAHQILLADEINRTSPKTQASLLEAMAERQVTVDGTIYRLPAPFMVIATQNPIEFLGTYPLPEAQMDRFLMRLSIGYPGRKEEIRMAAQFLEGITPDTIRPVCRAGDLLEIQEAVKKIKVHGDLLGYIADIILLTREEGRFVLGASPRAMLALVSASQAAAFLSGRDYCKPDDVKQIALPVLGHRLVLTPDARLKQENVLSVLKSLVLKAKVPIL
jgi:MoxR-like ATPase